MIKFPLIRVNYACRHSNEREGRDSAFSSFKRSWRLYHPVSILINENDFLKIIFTSANPTSWRRRSWEAIFWIQSPRGLSSFKACGVVVRPIWSRYLRFKRFNFGWYAIEHDLAFSAPDRTLKNLNIDNEWLQSILKEKACLTWHQLPQISRKTETKGNDFFRAQTAV